MCCGPLHRGEEQAVTAEALMRSRFSAFARALPDYLLRTWHGSTRPATLELDAGTTWTRLRILRVGLGGPQDTTGTVEFRAHFRSDGERGAQTEHSRFLREGGRWRYLDDQGETPLDQPAGAVPR